MCFHESSESGLGLGLGPGLGLASDLPRLGGLQDNVVQLDVAVDEFHAVQEAHSRQHISEH